MNNDIISSVWCTVKLPVLSNQIMIGVIAVQCRISKHIKFYIGLASGEDLERDEKTIYRMGVPFYPLYFVSWVQQVMKSVPHPTNKPDKSDRHT